LEKDQSKAVIGPARGQELGGLLRQWGARLLGNAQPFEGHFPLLIKFLDAEKDLSVQVHPDKAIASRSAGDVRVKNEAWYIIETRGDAAIYHGLKDGVDRRRFEQAVEQNQVPEMLRRIPVKAGDCYYLPGGTLHALGKGVVAAEVQTPSDTTYRVHDWDHNGRQLHIAEALECIAFGRAEARPKRSHVADVWRTVTHLVACESFAVHKVRTVEGVVQPIADGTMMVWIVLSGKGRLTRTSDRLEVAFVPGDVVLLPAAAEQVHVATESDCEWLEVTVPSGAGV
jgi:mannose-6-phosphate isomerase